MLESIDSKMARRGRRGMRAALLRTESRRELCAESMLPGEAEPAVELANITARTAAKHAC